MHPLKPTPAPPVELSVSSPVPGSWMEPAAAIPSSACLFRGCGSVPSSGSMTPTRVPHSSTPHREALLPQNLDLVWYPKAHHHQNPTFLNTSHTAATRLPFLALFFLQRCKYCLFLSNICLWPPLPPPCQWTGAWSHLFLGFGALQHTEAMRQVGLQRATHLTQQSYPTLSPLGWGLLGQQSWQLLAAELSHT